jgi:serine phosphatase RsbU (regulator of sigma subunit)
MRRREQGLLAALPTPDGTRLVGFSLVPGTGWLVVVDRSHEAVIGPLDTALWAEIAVLALLAVVGVMVTLNVGRRLDRLDAARDVALAEQRDIAVELQRSLLPQVPSPPSLDVHAAYAPAQGPMSVGGDWYDVVELDDGRVALTVGDVAGHGLPAAAAMGQLRSAVRTLALAGAEPAAALGQLDRFTCTLHGNPLATTVFAVLDPTSGELRYACAGHPPPLVVRADRTTAFLRDGRSPLLGVDPPGARSEGRAALAPGDVLVVYTDGLIERPAHSLDEGMTTLAARASAAARAGADAATLAQTLLAGVEEPRRDDTAVLCVALVGAPDAAGAGPADGDAQPSSVPS